MNKTLADKLVSIAVQQREAGNKIKQPRIDTIKKIEDLYYNKITASFDARINIPIPFMSGQIDTVRAKIDNRPTIEFVPGEEGDIKLAKKVTESWRIDSSSMRAAWNRKDRQEKFLALMSGRGISKIYATNDNGKYTPHYEVIDYMDFYCEGTQGHLEDNLYCGLDNIFKTPDYLEEQAALGFYDKEQVARLISTTGSDEYKRNEDVYQNKFNRMKALGLTPELNAYVGQEVINLTEHCMDYEGKRYYLFFDPKSGIWVRCEELKDVYPVGEFFPGGVWPFVSWACFDEPFQFWTKGYGDDIMPIAEGTRIVINQVMNNTMRQNQPMKAVDQSVFPDTNELKWRMPDQLVLTTPGMDPSKGIYTFETPNITASLDVAQYLNQYVAQKTGVNAEAQGASDSTEQKVGIYYGNVKESNDRIGLVEKNYNESYAEKGYRYYWGLRNNITELKMIQMIGKNGVNWDSITKSEMRKASDFDVIVTGGSAEQAADAIKQKQMAEAIAQLSGNAKTLEKLSPEWIVEQTLNIAGFDKDEIRRALDTEGSADEELMSDAAESIQMILEGRMPRLNRGANVAFLKKLFDFDADELDYIKLDKKGNQIGIDKEKFEQSQMLRAYADAHYDVVIENTMRNAKMQARLEEMKVGAMGGQVGAPEGANPITMGQPGIQEQNQMSVNDQAPSLSPENLPQGTPEATAQRSAQITGQVAPIM